jgi:hypothetical protein
MMRSGLIWLKMVTVAGSCGKGNKNLNSVKARNVFLPRVRFPALPNFLSSSGSGTGSTQPL